MRRMVSHRLEMMYRKICNISCTKPPNLNVSWLVSQLSVHNPMKPGVKSSMEM